MRVAMTRTIETRLEDGTPVRYAKGEPWTFSTEQGIKLIEDRDAVLDEDHYKAEAVLVADQKAAAEKAAAEKAAAEQTTPESTLDEAPAARRARRSATETAE